jgi:DNA-binding NarL/FixJ family response regulator
MFTLGAVAALAATHGEAEQAVRLASAAAATGDAIGATPPHAFRAALEADLDLARHALGQSMTTATQALGRLMTLDQAVDEALGWLEALQDRPSRDAELAGVTAARPDAVVDGVDAATDLPGAVAGTGLTPRELAVVRLLGRGLSNRQIAEELVITPGTAGNYVSRVMDRLGFQSRAQVAAWAVEQGLARAPRPDAAD